MSDRLFNDNDMFEIKKEIAKMIKDPAKRAAVEKEVKTMLNNFTGLSPDLLQQLGVAVDDNDIEDTEPTIESAKVLSDITKKHLQQKAIDLMARHDQLSNERDDALSDLDNAHMTLHDVLNQGDDAESKDLPKLHHKFIVAKKKALQAVDTLSTIEHDINVLADDVDSYNDEVVKTLVTVDDSSDSAEIGCKPAKSCKINKQAAKVYLRDYVGILTVGAAGLSLLLMILRRR